MAKPTTPITTHDHHLPTITTALIEALFMTPATVYGHWGIAFVLWGPPGVGKSSIVNEAASACGMPCIPRLAPIEDPTSFGGMPVVAVDGAVNMAPLRWAKEVAELGNAVLFIDEITASSRATQNALLGLMLDRRVGDLWLPRGVRVVAAGNPPEITMQGLHLGQAQSNRLSHWRIDADFDGFRAWMGRAVVTPNRPLMGKAQPPSADLEQRQADLLVRWPSEFATAWGLVDAFLTFSRANEALDTFMRMPTEDAVNYGTAWPSPRSWEMFTRALAGLRMHGFADDVAAQVAVAKAVLGPHVATQLTTWLAYPNLPQPEDWLRDLSTFAHDDQSPIATVLMLAATARYIEGLDADHERRAALKALCPWVTTFFATRADLAMHGIRALLGGPRTKKMLADVKQSVFVQLLRAAYTAGMVAP